MVMRILMWYKQLRFKDTVLGLRKLKNIIEKNKIKQNRMRGVRRANNELIKEQQLKNQIKSKEE